MHRTDHGLALLDAAADILGGTNRFDDIEAIRFSGHTYSGSGPEEGGGSVEMLTPFPEADGLWMHIVSDLNDSGPIQRVLAGDQLTVNGMGDFPPDLVADAVRYASTKLITLLRYRNHPDTVVEYVGREKTGDAAVEVVRVVLQGTESEIELAADSRQVVAVRFQSSPIQEQVDGQVVRRVYTDFRQVDGFVLPFHQTVSVGGELYSKWRVETVEVNPDYDPTIFGWVAEAAPDSP